MCLLRATQVSTLVLIACFALPGRSAAPDLYPPPEQAQADIHAALDAAASQRKRVILDFGGNWCSSCHVFDINVHDFTNKPILDAHYILVHINVGDLDRNLEIASRYGIPLKEGLPALVIVDARGNLVYRQTTAEAIAMKRMKTTGVTQILRGWIAHPAVH